MKNELTFMNTLENAFLQFIDSFLYSSQQVKMGKNYFYEKIWGNHATSVSDGLSGRIVAVSGSDPGSTFRYPGLIEVWLFDIRCTTTGCQKVELRAVSSIKGASRGRSRVPNIPARVLG